MENRRILLIDDNHSIHEDYRKILSPDASKNSNDRFSDLKAHILKQGTAKNSQQEFVLGSAYQGQEGLERLKPR